MSIFKKEKKTYTWWQYLIGGAGVIFSAVTVLSTGWMAQGSVQSKVANLELEFLMKLDDFLIFLGIL